MFRKYIARFILPFVPLLLFLLIVLAPSYSVRLSAALHGYPFVSINPTGEFFHLRSGIDVEGSGKIGVYSNSQHIGWIYQKRPGCARFIPDSGSSEIDDVNTYDAAIFDYAWPFAWSLRWYILLFEPVFDLIWYHTTGKKVWMTAAGNS